MGKRRCDGGCDADRLLGTGADEKGEQARGAGGRKRCAAAGSSGTEGTRGEEMRRSSAYGLAQLGVLVTVAGAGNTHGQMTTVQT